MFTNPTIRKKINVGPEGVYLRLGSAGKSEMASRIMEVVRSNENVLPASCDIRS
jgi:hypothetical protein